MFIFESRVFCYKETIASGTAAAAHGGYTAVCAMPI
jgi:dihydroorotase